ncbi:hypothetical protein E4Q23_16130 [Candidatus Accumulibacter phosphatis]|uniref:Uncharacterized protein n=1 Tax=Candidatus Accumulibacter phosphatis TaxID=327160 RepID=A0ABX1U102_9PROT|nr:hypothetical protein [Candidatus Accumulibacter phosphatis]NMQ29153.1 hypothetical protein [Candidatus Accumulibacter phosphatis]
MNTATPEFDVRSIHRRQKPLVGTPSIERLLLRQVSLVCPESRLCVSVIKQAFVDLCSSSWGIRRDARRFFHDGRLTFWCDLVDLNPEFVREIALKTGYLPAQETLKKEAS